MNPRILIIAIVLCLCTQFSPVARADAAAQVHKQIQAAYSRQDSALSHKDLRGAMAYTDPSFTGTGMAGGKQTYQTRASSLPQLFSVMKTIHMTTVIQKFKMQGPKTALVEAKSKIVMTAVDPKTKRLQSATFDNVVDDRWVKRAHGWMLVQTFQIGKDRVH